MARMVCTAALSILVAAQLVGCAFLRAGREAPAPEPVVEPEPVEQAVEPMLALSHPALLFPHAMLVFDLDAVDTELEHYRNALLDAGRPALARQDVGYFMDVLDARLRRQLADSGIEFERSDEQVRVTLPTEAAFAFGSVRLHEASRDLLDTLGTAIAGFDQALLSVHGHTDITGTVEVNRRISEQRALAVARHLVDQGVVSAGIAIVGHGPSQPIASNDTEEGRARNRRVELRITPLVREH